MRENGAETFILMKKTKVQFTHQGHVQLPIPPKSGPEPSKGLRNKDTEGS